MHMHIPQQKSGQTFCQHSKWLCQLMRWINWARETPTIYTTVQQGVESILQSLGFKGYEDMIQRDRSETDSVSLSREDRDAWQQEWKKKNSGIKGQKEPLVEQDSEHTPWDYRFLIPWKRNSGFPPSSPKKHLYISFGFPLQGEGQAGWQRGPENPNGKSCARFFEPWALPVNWSYFHE